MPRHQRRRQPLLLKLYVAGGGPNSVLALANVKAFCARHFADNHELQVVDLIEHPLEALSDRIIVTPTLLKLLPLPVRRMIGNLSDSNQMLLTLGSP